jgi:tRNA nucleotidyltransferase (CCA-adding enzyme)
MIATTVQAAGGRAWLVGGTARDLVMGRTPRDYDLEVFGLSADRLAALLAGFGAVNEVGKAFAVFKVGPIDVSLPRRDSKAGTGHRGFAIAHDPLLSATDAARRRDFTINALFIDPLTGERFDPWRGMGDIEHRRLRCVDPLTFSDDPLRVLRGMQLAARLGLSMDHNTVIECRRMQPELRTLPVERIREEWIKLLLAPTPSLGLALGRETGVIATLFPELHALISCPQDPVWHPEGDVWTHTLQAVDIAAELAVHLDTPRRLAVVLGTLCHDLGKPSTTAFRNERVISHAHDTAGVEIADTFLNRLDVHRIDDYHVHAQVLALVEHHLKPAMLFNANMGRTVSDSAFRRLALKVDFELLALVARADTLGRVPLGATLTVNPARVAAIDWFVERAAHLQVTHAGPTPLLLGRHLLDLGLSPGPRIGAICRAVFELQLDGQVTTLDEARSAAQGLITQQQETP